MQWNAARLRPRINFNLHHHGTSFTWHPDGYICNDLRPIVWVSVSIQILRGLTLGIGALRHFTMNCKARKPCCTYLPPPVLIGPSLMIHYRVSLSLPPDVVVTSDGTKFFIVTAYAFCFGGFFGVFFFCCWWLPPPLPWPV